MTAGNCYIESMLLDSHLVPETIAKPRSFVGLMALYESNYLRLLRLIPELDRIDGCQRSRVAGDCDLHVEILERSRYTLTLSLTYHFETDDGLLVDPDMTVRAYLDGQLAEVHVISPDGELLRTIGFSSSPGLIRVLAIIPGMGALVQLAAMIWMLAAMVIAVRQALDYKSTWRAVGVCCIGFVIQFLIIMLLFSVFGGAPQPGSL